MISIVMVSYRTGDVLFRAIEAILNQATPFELIIVDNGNSSTCVTRLETLCKEHGQEHAQLKLISGHGNLGFAKACNLGAAQAVAPHLALINPDCIIEANCLANVLRESKQLSGKWLLGADLRNPDSSTQQGSRRAFLTPWMATVEALKLYKLAPNHPYFQRFNRHEESVPTEMSEIQAISGAFMVMPTKVYEEIGGMDESYFLHVEDLDFCLRHHLKGGKTYFSPNIRATHYKSSSQVSWFFIEYHKSISLCLYFERNFEDFYPPAFMVFLKGLIYTKLVASAIIHSVKPLSNALKRLLTHSPTINSPAIKGSSIGLEKGHGHI